MALSEKGKAYVAKREAEKRASAQRLAQATANQFNRKLGSTGKKYIAKDGLIYEVTPAQTTKQTITEQPQEDGTFKYEVQTETNGQTSTQTLSKQEFKKQDIETYNKFLRQRSYSSVEYQGKPIEALGLGGNGERIIIEKNNPEEKKLINVKLEKQTQVSKEALERNKPSTPVGTQTKERKDYYYEDVNGGKELRIKKEDKRDYERVPINKLQEKEIKSEKTYNITNLGKPQNRENRESMLTEVNKEPLTNEQIKMNENLNKEYYRKKNLEYGNYNVAQNPFQLQEYLISDAIKEYNKGDYALGTALLVPSAGIEYLKWQLGGKVIGSVSEKLVFSGTLKTIGKISSKTTEKLAFSGIPIISETSQVARIYGGKSLEIGGKVLGGVGKFTTGTTGSLLISGGIGTYVYSKTGDFGKSVVSGGLTFSGLKGFDKGFNPSLEKINTNLQMNEVIGSRTITTTETGKGFETIEQFKLKNMLGDEYLYTGLYKTSKGKGTIKYLITDGEGIVKTGSGKILNSQVIKSTSNSILSDKPTTNVFLTQTKSKLNMEIMPTIERSSITQTITPKSESSFFVKENIIKTTENFNFKQVTKLSQGGTLNIYPLRTTTYKITENSQLFTSIKNKGTIEKYYDYGTYLKQNLIESIPERIKIKTSFSKFKGVNIGKKGSLAITPNFEATFNFKGIPNIIETTSGTKLISKPITNNFYMQSSRLFSNIKNIGVLRSVGIGGYLTKENTKLNSINNNNIIGKSETQNSLKYESRTITNTYTQPDTLTFFKSMELTKPKTISQNTTTTNRIRSPPIPPVPFIPIIPFKLPTFAGGRGSQGIQRSSTPVRTKRSFAYTPTLRGLLTGIKQKNKNQRFTGIEVRGI